MINVTKRNGEVVPFDIEKVHRVIGWAIDGYTNVSVSDVEMNAKLNLYEGITTEKIHEALIKSASNLISLENPNYQYVAARLLNYSLRKQVWGESEPPRLFDHINYCILNNSYDKDILANYSESEIHKLGKYIKHNRDDSFTYSGLQQLVDKYLIKNRSSGVIYETPQFAYMLIAMIGFQKYPKETRLDYVKKFYDALSLFKLNLPTPIMAGVRSSIRQYASCTLFDCDDSLDSIFATLTGVGHYSAKRAGIGINTGRIRPINSYIRGGEVVHTGIIPYLKCFESVVKSTQQNGIRGASATINIPFWHPEIMDVLVLKNNAGTDENRVRKLDYVIQCSKLLYDRIIRDEEITLFSPHECKDLFDAFGMPEFDALYEKKEKDKSLKFKTKIKAREFAELLAGERFDTARIYIMNIDHCNSHNAFIDKVGMTNLCVEITQPTIPLKSILDELAEIGVCILACINALQTELEEVPNVADLIVRFLDELIDHQDYVVKAAENFTKNRRSLGIGFTNIAALFAHKKVEYGSPESLLLLDEYSEYLQYFLLKASCNLAKEKGPCAKFDRTHYSNGLLPIDTYCKSVDTIVSRDYSLPWDELRDEIQKYGLRNSTLTAQPPTESSSVIQNSTNGIEPIRELISYKKSKTGILTQIAPNIKSHKYYTSAWDIKSNQTLNNVSAVIQKWFDMAISTNHYYNPANFENGNVPRSVIIKDIIHAYKMGVKTLYYSNTNDGEVEQTSNCTSGACAI